MTSYKTSDLRKMGRRRFIESLTALGVSSGAAAALTPEQLSGLTDDPTSEVPRLGWYEFQNKEAVFEGAEPPQPEPTYYTVPREQWKQTEGAKKASQQLLSRFDDAQVHTAIRSHDNGVGVEVQYERLVRKVDGERITVREPSADIDDLKASVPDKASTQVTFGDKTDTVENIPVTFREKTNIEETRPCDEPAPSGCYFDREYRPLGGGCEMGGEGKSGCWATLGPPAYSNDVGEYVMTTAYHAVDESDEDPVHQPTDGNYIGDLHDYITGSNGDAAVIDVARKDDRYVTMGICDDGSDGMDWGVAGMVGQDRIEDMVATDEYIYVQGRRTGRNGGTIMTHDSGRSDPRVGYEISTDGGDSGAPIWDFKDGNAYIIGIHAWGECFDGVKGGEGNTMYHIEKELDLQYSQTWN